MMMSFSSLIRSRTLTVGVGVLFTITLTGCDFLGFGSDEPTEVVENDESGDDDDLTVLFDEEVEMVSDYSEPIEVEVPDNVYSLAISISETEFDKNYFVTDWTAPNDFEFVPDNWENIMGEMCYPDCNLRIMGAAGAFGAIAPNNPDTQEGVVPGTHEFTVGSQETGGFGMATDSTQQSGSEDVRVTVHAERVGDTVPESGTLDINFFFTDAEGWNAADAPDDDEIQDIIDEIDEIYDQVNIDIGEVAYHDVEGSYETLDMMSMMSADGDLAQLFEQSERAELDGPSVFFVEDLGMAAGIAPAIPGPMQLHGSTRSGVAVATGPSRLDGGIADVTAHELGHHFGLFHTTEQDQGFGMGGGPEHDPLPDTDEDDTSYLMHATPAGREMSEWQGRVMRKNPWVTLGD